LSAWAVSRHFFSRKKPFFGPRDRDTRTESERERERKRETCPSLTIDHRNICEH
jgi:hypothetical protein